MRRLGFGPALAGLAGKVAGEDRQHVDPLVEAQPEFETLAPGDDAVELLAGFELELEPLAFLQRQIGVEHGAAGADLADEAQLPDAADDERARLQR